VRPSNWISRGNTYYPGFLQSPPILHLIERVNSSNWISLGRAIFMLSFLALTLKRLCSSGCQKRLCSSGCKRRLCYSGRHAKGDNPRTTKEQQQKLATNVSGEYCSWATQVPSTDIKFADHCAEHWADNIKVRRQLAKFADHCAEHFGSDKLKDSATVEKPIAKGARVFVGGRAGTVVYGPDLDGEHMIKFDDSSKQSGFLKADSIKRANDGTALLELEPKHSIHFKCNGPGSLSVSNASSGPVAFRVQTTAPKGYIVHPARVTLRPGEQREVHIGHKHGGASIKDRFLVTAAPVCNHAHVSLEEWQLIPKNMIEQYRLSVVIQHGHEVVGTEVTHMFKVGDRVSSLMEVDPAWNGTGTDPECKVGEIVEIDDSNQPYKIRFDDGYAEWYKPHWIDTVEKMGLRDIREAVGTVAHCDTRDC